MECPLCPAAATTDLDSFKELRRHLHCEHALDAIHVYACPACPRAFKDQVALTRHLFYKHDLEFENFKDKLKKRYFGFTCSDCGLYLRIGSTARAEEWEAFVELMEKHSSSQLKPTFVYATARLTKNPKIKLEFARVERKKKSDSFECPHCRESFVGRERIKIHLLQGKCTVRQPVCGLALLANKAPSQTAFYEQKEQDSFGIKGYAMDERLLHHRVVRLAVAVEIPVLRKASTTTIPFTPKGTPRDLHNCARCKVLISGPFNVFNHVCFDGAKGLPIDSIYSYHRNTVEGAKSRIPCFVCKDHTACSVAGLQAHLTLHHDLDYRVDKDVDTSPEVGAQSRHSSRHSSRHCSPIKSPAAKRPSVDMPELAPLKLKIPRTSTSSRDPSHDRKGAVRAEFDKETGRIKLITTPLSTDTTQAAPTPSSSTSRPMDPQQPSTSSSRQDDPNLDNSYEDGGLMIAEDDEPMDVEAREDVEMEDGKGEKKDEDSPFDIDDMMEDTEKVEDDKKKKEDAAGSNGVDAKTNGHGGASNGHAQNGLSHEDESLQKYHLSLYTSPPNSKYTPDDGFFMLCRLCMTVIPAGGDHFQYHVDFYHNAEKQDYISCSECSLLVLRSEIRQHDAEHAWTKYICSITKKAFASDTHYYLYRKEEHNVDLVHFCKRCNIATKRADLMKEHILKGDCRRGHASPKDEQYMMFPRPVPGMIAECFFNFDLAMKSEGPFVIRINGQNRMTASQCCASEDCSRDGLLERELVAVRDWDAARLFKEEDRQMIRHARLSCPVDGFPLPYHRYRYHEFGPYEKPVLILEEEEKKLKKQIKDVKGRNRQEFDKIDEYFGNDPWRLNCLSTVEYPEEADEATAAVPVANSPAASATAAAVCSPAAAVAAAASEEDDEEMPTADNNEEAGPSSGDAEASSSRKALTQGDPEFLKGRVEAEFKIYQEMGYKVDLYVKNFCKRGERFPYTAEQIKETRIDVNTFMTKQEMTKCLFCHSSQGLFPVQREKRDGWIDSFVESMEAAVLKYTTTNACTKSFTNIYNGKLNKKPNLRVCARHFDPAEIDGEGMLQDKAVPKYLWRKCLLCKAAIHNKEGAGLEMPIYYKEQLRALLAVRTGEDKDKDIPRLCEEGVQYACPICVVHAADASPADTLSEQVRERIAALRAKRAKAMASSTVGSSTGSTEGESSESLLGVLHSAMRHAKFEPPTPAMPVRQPSVSPPLQQPPEQAEFLEPPTPRGVLNSAMRLAAFEPPTPAPFARETSESPPLGLIRSAGRDRALEPPTPAQPVRQPSPVFVEPPTPRGVLNSAMRLAALEPPTPAPVARETSESPPLGLIRSAGRDRELEPPTPAQPSARSPPPSNSQSNLSGVLNSALRYAAQEPPTPAPYARQASESPPPAQQPVFLEPPTPRTYKPLLDAPVNLDAPPATPGHQEQVGQIRSSLLADAPQTQPHQQRPAAVAMPPPAAAQPQPVVRNPPQPTAATIRHQPILQPVAPQFPQMLPPQLPASYLQLPPHVRQRVSELIQIRHQGGVPQTTAEKNVHEWVQNVLQRIKPTDQQWPQILDAQEKDLRKMRDVYQAKVRAQLQQQAQQQQQQHLLQQQQQQPQQQHPLQQQQQLLLQQQQQQQMQLFFQHQMNVQRLQQAQVQQAQMQQPQVQQPQTPAFLRHLAELGKKQDQQGVPQQHNPHLLQQPQQQQQRHQHPQQPTAGPSGLLMPMQQQQQLQQQQQQQQQHLQQQQQPQQQHQPQRQQLPQQAGPSGSHMPVAQQRPPTVQHLQQQQPGPSNASPQVRPPQPQQLPQGLPSTDVMIATCLEIYRHWNVTEAELRSNADMLESMGHSEIATHYMEATRQQTAIDAAEAAAPAAAAAAPPAAPAAPSTSAAAAAAAAAPEDPMAKWNVTHVAAPFECVLCNPCTKPVRTKRIMPTTDSVEPHLDQLGLAKGSFRRQYLAALWADGGHLEMGICLAHLTDPEQRASESGKMCNVCAHRYIAPEVGLHEANHGKKDAYFCCLDCCIVMSTGEKFTEQRVVAHMIKNHKMKPAELRIDCPFKNDPKAPCNHTSGSIEEYRRHLSDPTQKHYGLLFYQLYQDSRSHKCCLRFTNQDSMVLHNALVVEEKKRLDIKEDIAGRECCPLCGSINLWEEESEGQKISHFTLHQLEWTIMCRYDLKTLRRGDSAKWHHVNNHSGQGNFCKACNSHHDEQQMIHADTHLMIGLKIRPNTEPIACDNSRALLGLSKIGGDPMEMDD